MNFFKSIFTDDDDDDRDPVEHDNPHEPDSNSPHKEQDSGDHDESADVWGFGGLMKSLATRSESVIETYRKDLQEFGSGLKKETEVLREVASRAAKDLPTSLEARASAAQGALDGVLKSTAELIGKETSFFGEPEAVPETSQSLSSGRYSWFDSQLSAIQSDLNTFCNEPEDVEEYRKWKLGFKLDDKRKEIEDLMGENVSLDNAYEKVVPSVVDEETFWYRYFYKVDKIEQQERVRANLVKRTISIDDDEDFSWDVEDEDEGVNVNEQMVAGKTNGGSVVGDKVASEESHNPIDKQEESNSGSLDDEKEKSNLNVNNGVEESSKSNENLSLGAKEGLSNEVAEVKSYQKVESEESAKKKNDEKIKEENVEFGTKSDAVSVLGKHSKVGDEEDLEWDEIEDTGSGDEKKTSAAGSSGIPNRAELKKRLSVEEDDEDLNWDIEDDD